MPERNPIYDRFVQPERWPSEFGAWLIGVGSGALGFAVGVVCLIIADALKNADYTLIPVGLAALAIVVAVILLLISLILAASATARFYTSEEYALLRLTSVEPEVIHSGLVGGNHFRLRIIRNVGLWFMLTAIVGIALIVGTMSLIIECFQGPCWNSQVGYALIGALPAAVIVGVLMAIISFLWKLCVNMGVWIGLRAGKSAVVIASGLAVSVLVGCSLLALSAPTLIGYNYSTYEMVRRGSVICLGMFLALPLLSFGLVRLMRYDSVRFIKSHANLPGA